VKKLKQPRCTTCGHPTANRKRVCGPCLGGGIARLSWRQAHAPAPGVEGLPRVVRVNLEGGRCGGGWRRPAHRGEY
jgi:hypothetical protein